MDYRSEWKDAATTRPDRLTTALTETLTDRAPSPAAVELHDAVIAWTRRMRDDGLSAANAIAILRGATRATLEPRVTSFALHRCAHMIVGDVTRWCLVEYFRRNGTGAWEPAVDDRVPS